MLARVQMRSNVATKVNRPERLITNILNDKQWIYDHVQNKKKYKNYHSNRRIGKDSIKYLNLHERISNFPYVILFGVFYVKK